METHNLQYFHDNLWEEFDRHDINGKLTQKVTVTCTEENILNLYNSQFEEKTVYGQVHRYKLYAPKGKEIIWCVCMTCGYRNNEENESKPDSNGFCGNDHDNWLEYRDFKVAENDNIIEEATKIFGVTRKKLWELFLTNKDIAIPKTDK